MDDVDRLWNMAGQMSARDDVPEGKALGLASLAYLLRFYNATMGGGLDFAFEANDKFRVRRAIQAAAYFGLADLAAFWKDLLVHFPDYDYIEARYEAYGEMVPRDAVIVEAFRSKLADSPGEFALAE